MKLGIYAINNYLPQNRSVGWHIFKEPAFVGFFDDRSPFSDV